MFSKFLKNYRGEVATGAVLSLVFFGFHLSYLRYQSHHQWTAFLYPKADRNPLYKIELGIYRTLDECKTRGSQLIKAYQKKDQSIFECATLCTYEDSYAEKICQKSESILE